VRARSQPNFPCFARYAREPYARGRELSKPAGIGLHQTYRPARIHARCRTADTLPTRPSTQSAAELGLVRGHCMFVVFNSVTINLPARGASALRTQSSDLLLSVRAETCTALHPQRMSDLSYISSARRRVHFQGGKQIVSAAPPTRRAPRSTEVGARYCNRRIIRRKMRLRVHGNSLRLRGSSCR